jgi:hypothetical protein
MFTRWRLTFARKSDFLFRQLGQNGDAVLDAQPFDLAMPQVAAKPYKVAPRGRQATVVFLRVLDGHWLHIVLT